MSLTEQTIKRITMNKILNKLQTNNIKNTSGFKNITDLLGLSLANLLQKNMLYIAKSLRYPELNLSRTCTDLFEHGNNHFEIIVELNSIVSVRAHYQAPQNDRRKQLTYHVYAIVKSCSHNNETELIHKYENTNLREVYSFANELLIQHKYLPSSVWGKDAFCE